MEFINSTAKEVCYSGAFGAGKSRALCYKICKSASIKRNVVGLCRKTRVALMRTTLRTLLLPDGDLPPVLPIGSYEHRKGDAVISLNGGGEIMYFGFDNADAVGSMNLGSCGIDEGIELNEDEYSMLLGRCRVRVDPYRQLFTATNPGNPNHFLYRRFFKESHRNRHTIHTTSFENMFLPRDYIDSLRTLTGPRYDRYVLGKWIAFEGLVYDMFRREVHVKHRPRNELIQDYAVGFDEGYTNPAVLLLFDRDYDGRLHVLDEWYSRRKTHDQIVARALEFLPRPNDFVGDPSAAALISAMQSVGLNAHGGNNDVWNGIRAMQARLTVASDGLPRYTVEPHCTNHITEFESYVWDAAKDKPIKEMDHSLDSARYYVYDLDQDQIEPTVGGGGMDEYDDLDEELREIETQEARMVRIASTDDAWSKF
jgi:PBSX family phage terminase large subunit